MTIGNEKERAEIRALIEAQIELPDHWADPFNQRGMGRLLAALAEASRKKKHAE